MCLTVAGYCSCQQNVAVERIQQERINNDQKDPKEGKKGRGLCHKCIWTVQKHSSSFIAPTCIEAKKIYSRSDILNLRQKIYFIFLIFFLNEWRSNVKQLFPNKELKDLIYPTVQIPMTI